MLEKPVLEEPAVAILTIHRAPKMTRRDRYDLALWLRKQAEALERDGNNYPPSFTATFDANP